MGNIYENIKVLCNEHNIKPAQMCRAIGIGPSTMTELKMGRQVNLSTSTAQKIASYFGVPVEMILGTDDDMAEMRKEAKEAYEKTMRDFEAIDISEELKQLEEQLQNIKAKTAIINDSGLSQDRIDFINRIKTMGDVDFEKLVALADIALQDK